MKNLSTLLSLACLVGTTVAGASAQYHARQGFPAALANTKRHRTRAAMRVPNLEVRANRKSSKCKKKKVKSNPKLSNSTSTGSAPGDALNYNGVYIGMLPDGGSDGGEKDTMATLNQLISSTGKRHQYYGQYAQASGQNWDGGQLTQVMDDLKASGAVFQPAVMPTQGWSGLTSQDNSLAMDICNVMKQFTDEGIEVWLRFAHEVNYYITDGTYQGTAQDFKEGWATVAAACKQVAPDVKMFFTPNVADLGTYEQFFPDDPSTVDIIGIDFYPKDSSQLETAFLSAMQPFHDKYASASTAFAIGETGLGYDGPAADKLTWMKSIVNAKDQMQYLEGVAWFNYNKGYSFKIVDPNDSSTTDMFTSWVSGGGNSGGSNSTSSDS